MCSIGATQYWKQEPVPAPSSPFGNCAPDLVVIDPELPDMCGFDAVDLIQKDETTANMPVIALTALNSAEGRQKAADAKFAHYLTKPIIDIHELRDSMRLHL